MGDYHVWVVAFFRLFRVLCYTWHAHLCTGGISNFMSYWYHSMRLAHCMNLDLFFKHSLVLKVIC